MWGCESRAQDSDIVRVVEVEIAPKIREQLQRLLQACFPDYPSRSYYKLPPHVRYLAISGEMVIAQVGVELRMIRVGESVFRTFGVVDLCVAADQRSRGLGSRLLTEVTDHARRNGIDFVVLFADDDRIYLRNGWEHVGNRCRWVRIHEHKTLGLATEALSDAMMVRAVGDRAWPEGDVDLLGHVF
jgi:GNAT superfamily N-acetyltransferase